VPDATEHGGVGVRWDGLAAGQPFGEVGVGVFQDDFQLVEFGWGHAGDFGFHEVADEEVVLVGAAVLGAEDHPAAPDV
jgi:hypothetical protein